MSFHVFYLHLSEGNEGRAGLQWIPVSKSGTAGDVVDPFAPEEDFDFDDIPPTAPAKAAPVRGFLRSLFTRR